jgi:hypothetical protein
MQSEMIVALVSVKNSLIKLINFENLELGRVLNYLQLLAELEPFK